MLSGLMGHRDNGLFESGRSPIVVGIGNELAAQVHRLGQQRNQCSGEDADFGVVGELFGEVLDFAHQMGIAVLQPARNLVIAVVAVDDEHTRSEERRVGKEWRSRWWRYN